MQESNTSKSLWAATVPTPVLFIPGPLLPVAAHFLHIMRNRFRSYGPDASGPKLILWLAATALACFLVAALTGCAGLQGQILRPEPVRISEIWATNRTEVPITNQVADASGAVREEVLFVEKNVVTFTPETIVTNWVVAPQVSAIADTTGAVVNAFAPGVGTAISLGFGAITTLWAGWLNRRNKRISESLVTGIEDARRAVRAAGATDLDRQIVDLLQRHQLADGTQREVAALVDRLTGFTNH